MSAYVVDPAHVSYLLQAAITRNRPYGIYYGAWDSQDRERIDEHNASRIGSDLMRENIASVMSRYLNSGHDDLPGPITTPAAIDYTYRHSPYANLDPVNVLKAISGYEYQSCEHPEWETSNAKAFCDRLRLAMIDNLAGYDESPYWSVTDDMMYPTRDGSLR